MHVISVGFLMLCVYLSCIQVCSNCAKRAQSIHFRTICMSILAFVKNLQIVLHFHPSKAAIHSHFCYYLLRTSICHTKPISYKCFPLLRKETTWRVFTNASHLIMFVVIGIYCKFYIPLRVVPNSLDAFCFVQLLTCIRSTGMFYLTKRVASHSLTALCFVLMLVCLMTNLFVYYNKLLILSTYLLVRHDE